MLKIGEFSQLGQVSVRTLRHYDDLGLLKPATTDRFTDYRYYAVEQLPRLNRILALRDLGFSLDQIRGLLDASLPPDELRGMLRLRRAELEREIAETTERLARVESRLRHIEQEGQPSPYDVLVKPLEPRLIASVRALVPALADMPTYRCEMYARVYAALAASGRRPAGPEMAVYHLADYCETDIDTELGVCVGEPVEVSSGVAVRQLPAERLAATTIHTGCPDGVTDAIIALYTWIGTNGLTSTGPIREVHLYGRELDLDEDSANRTVTEVQIPVAPAR